MTTQKDAMDALKRGGKLVNRYVVQPKKADGTISVTGRLNKRQVKNVEAQGAKPSQEGDITVHKL